MKQRYDCRLAATWQFEGWQLDDMGLSATLRPAGHRVVTLRCCRPRRLRGPGWHGDLLHVKSAACISNLTAPLPHGGHLGSRGQAFAGLFTMLGHA